jgi:hypothetical protein
MDYEEYLNYINHLYLQWLIDMNCNNKSTVDALTVL